MAKPDKHVCLHPAGNCANILSPGRVRHTEPMETEMLSQFSMQNMQARAKRAAAFDLIDRDFCIVLCRHDGEYYFAETRIADATESQVAADIASGQIEHPYAVFSLNVADNSSRDVSEDTARAVLSKMLDDDGKIADHVVDFLEEHLGCRDVAQAVREWLS